MLRIRVSTTILTLDIDFVPEQIFNYETESRMERQENDEIVVNLGDKFPIPQPIIVKVKRKHIDYDAADAFVTTMNGYIPNLNRFYYYNYYMPIQKAFWVWNFGEDKTIIEGKLIMVPTNADGWV
jgi:hypothetical protein